MIKTAFFSDDAPKFEEHVIDKVYSSGRRQKLAEISDLYPEIVTTANFEEHVQKLQELEVIFSAWGMPHLTEDQVKRLPNLKAVFFAAGATQSFRDPFIQNGVRVFSASSANAIPVAEFTLGQILLACKGYFYNSRSFSGPGVFVDRQGISGPGVYGKAITIIGNGTISNYLQQLLKNFNLEVIVVPSRMEKRTVSFEEAFERSQVVVNLLPDRDDNVGVLNGSLFQRMPPVATFINVGRGRQVNEAELISVLKERPDLTALLDVQYPEPPQADSELYSLENVELSTHIAGSINDELIRMADYMIEDFQRFERGENLQHEVDMEKL